MLGQELFQQREGELRAWEDKVLERRFRGHEQRTRLKRELDRMVEADRTVRARDKQQTSLIRVESLKSEGKSGFRMTSWLFTPRDPKGRPLGEKCELDMAGIPERLAEIRDLVADQVADLNQVRFEFLVSIELLCREVDQWTVREQLSNDETPIGFHHQVVVRCGNRLKGTLLSKIRNRYDEITCCTSVCKLIDEPRLDESAPLAACWLPTLPVSKEQFRNLCLDRHIGCILLACPISPDEGNLMREKLGRVLDAGIPLIVWCRAAERRRTGTPTGPHRTGHARRLGRASEAPVAAPEVLCILSYHSFIRPS